MLVPMAASGPSVAVAVVQRLVGAVAVVGVTPTRTRTRRSSDKATALEVAVVPTSQHLAKRARTGLQGS